MKETDLIVDLLNSILGNINSHYSEKGQISFDCPTCSYEIKGLDTLDGKGNLEVNYLKGVYKCWACSETHDTHGSLNKLFFKWGNKQHRKTWNLISPEEFKPKTKKYKKLELPQDFISFEKGNQITIPYKEAFNYLLKRNITKDMILKYSIGYTTQGPYRGRVIVPSFDEKEDINYFVARSYTNHRMKYKNPESPKEEIIFNESKINWEDDVYLVEGVFDMFFIENSIPILGKILSEKLWEKLYNKCKSNIVICLDGDAWEDAQQIYRKLDGGKLTNRIRLVKIDKDKDVAELGGVNGLLEVILR